MINVFLFLYYHKGAAFIHRGLFWQNDQHSKLFIAKEYKNDVNIFRVGYEAVFFRDHVFSIVHKRITVMTHPPTNRHFQLYVS